MKNYGVFIKIYQIIIITIFGDTDAKNIDIDSK